MSLPDYDNFAIGHEVGPIEIVLDAQRVRNFAYATDDFDPWYLFDSPFGGAISPVPLLTSDDLEFAPHMTRSTHEDVLAAKFEIRAFEPIRIGQRLLLRSRNVEKYVRRSKGYIARDFEALAADTRRPFMRYRLTEMVGALPEGTADSGVSASDAAPRIVPDESALPVAVRAARDLPVGTALPALTKTVTRKQMFVFSARPGWWNSIHTDPELARSLGFPDAIAQGLMSTGYVSQMGAGFFR